MDHKPNLLGLMRQTMRLKHYRMCTERASIEYSALYALPRAAPSGCHGRASRAHFSVTSGRGTPGCRLDPTSSMKRHSVSVTGYRVGPCHRPHHSPGPVGALCAGDGAAWRWGPGVPFPAQHPLMLIARRRPRQLVGPRSVTAAAKAACVPCPREAVDHSSDGMLLAAGLAKVEFEENGELRQRSADSVMSAPRFQRSGRY
jgi:hypothetical protein